MAFDRPSNRPNMSLKYPDEIASIHYVSKNKSDRREYRGIELTNQMKVLLISDPHTEKSAAALNVLVGSMVSPNSVLGLAHFLEHTLFQGTRKYPGQSQFSLFVANHGGQTNAFTSNDNTSYFFDVAPEQFREAAEMFGQFFQEPLLDRDRAERELGVIDNEHAKNIKDDGWRMLRVDSVTANPDHDFAKFTTGNRGTLQTVPTRDGIDVHQALLEFHERWYSANLMNVCLLGRESLDGLADMAVEIFRGVPNKRVPPPCWLDHPFTDRELGVLVRVVPVEDSRQIIYAFPLPDFRNTCRTNPAAYYAHLIVHKSDGGLLAHLKRLGWANSISCNVRYPGRGFGVFEITIDLSSRGIVCVVGVTRCFFQYLNMLRLHGPKKWFFDELKVLGRSKFSFQCKETPIEYVRTLSEAMATSSWGSLLVDQFFTRKYSPVHINEFESLLYPDRARITIVSKSFEGQTNRIERYYGIRYSVQPMPPELSRAMRLGGLNPEYRFPSRNHFIPEQFVLVESEPSLVGTPNLILCQPRCHLWFMQDADYELPIAATYIELTSPMAYQNAASAVLMGVAIQCFNDTNAEHFSAAECAGLTVSLQESLFGLAIRIHGFSECQPKALKDLCERLANLTIDPTRFEDVKEAYMRDLRNFEVRQPYVQANSYLALALTEKIRPDKRMLETAQSECSLVECESFFKAVLKKAFVQILVHGNMTSLEAFRMREVVLGKLKVQPLSYNELHTCGEYKLQEGEVYVLDGENCVHPTNAVVVYYQIGSVRENVENMQTVALSDLFCQVFAEPAFDVLRTREQLGYVVAGCLRKSLDAYGFRITVQSDQNPTFLVNRIDEFMNVYMRKHLEDMTPEVFENHKKVVVASKREKPRKFTDKTDRLWREILLRTQIFNRELLEAEAVAKLTKKDLLKFYERYVVRGAPRSRQMVVRVFSKVAPGEVVDCVQPTQIITDIRKFQRTHEVVRSSRTPSPQPSTASTGTLSELTGGDSGTTSRSDK